MIDERRRLCREWLRRIRLLSRNVAVGRHGALDDWPDRLAGDSIEDERVAALGDLRHRVDALSVHRDGHEVGLRRNIPVPQSVVNCLEMPFHFPGRRLETDQRLGVQVRARPLAAVVVARRR